VLLGRSWPLLRHHADDDRGHDLVDCAHYGGRMPTIPPARARPSEHEPHQHRQVAESFGSEAERYDRARPSYPGEMVDRIVAGSPGPGVLDVGCGTGIAARLEELLAGIGAAVDAVGGSFTMRYATVAVTATRTGGAAQPDALRP
jgi:SAM-dependent methyltransferase